ncbi:hypothetical protein [Nocardiopsis sp. LOL_012]|uniref:hypothetical protein n=1 Tax=Nocardiopsis sp. LOL_012 TaxID=3345409 RepID=UPI003A8B9A8E
MTESNSDDDVEYVVDPYGYDREAEGRDPDDYPYRIDRRYNPHPISPVGRSMVDELVEGRGEPVQDGDPNLVEPGEMACLVRARQNATQVLIDQGVSLRAQACGATESYAKAKQEVAGLERLRAHAEHRIHTGSAKLRDLKERFAHVPDKLKQPPQRLLMVLVYVSIVAFAILDMWFFYKFTAYYWGLDPETDQLQILAVGPLLGALVAMLVWVCGLLLGRNLWYLRAELAGAAERPETADDRSRARVAARRIGRVLKRSVLPLAGLLMALSTLALVGWFGYYRALDDFSAVPEVAVAWLILSLGLGAMVMKAVEQNPYIDRRAAALRGVKKARQDFEEAVTGTRKAVEKAEQHSYSLQGRRDEAMGLARNELDHAWSMAVLPARHRSGRSGGNAPAPAVLDDAGPGVQRLSRVPDDEEIRAFFQVFGDIPVPLPALASVHTVNERLARIDLDGLNERLEALSVPLPEVEDFDGAHGSVESRGTVPDAERES